MPLPSRSTTVNLWIVQDAEGGKEGWTLVDTGIAQTRELWETFLARFQPVGRA